MRCILWPDQFVHFGHMIEPDKIVVARGVIDKRPGTDEANVIVNELIPLADLAERCTRGVMVRVFEADHGEDVLDRLHTILCDYPGESGLQLLICLADGKRVCCKCDDVRLAATAEMRQRVEALLGPGNFRLLPGTPNGRSNSQSA
jgi:DNA polymerase-3 subunit alpha